MALAPRSATLDSAVRPVIESLEERKLLSVSLDGGTLSIIGTPDDDVIVVRPVQNGRLRVELNDEWHFFIQDRVQAIHIEGRAGNDYIEINEQLRPVFADATIYGGPGHDTIKGGSGNDALYGGRGHDLIIAGSGRNLLAGGAGHDRIFGGVGRDTIQPGRGDDHVVTENQRTVVRNAPGNVSLNQFYRHSFPGATWTPDPEGFNPTQIRNAYGFGNLTDSSFTNRGQGTAVAIITAFDAPTARRDLTYFANEFDLGPITRNNFQIVNAAGRRPIFDEGWSMEALQNIQWVKAIAPRAKIILVQADTNLVHDIDRAIDKAVSMLNRQFGGGVISMSLGGPEAQFLQVSEATFNNPQTRNITFVAAAGNDPATVSYPATSPHVTAVGGTTFELSPRGNRLSPEEPVDFGSGGASSLFPAPPWQQNRLGNEMRMTADISMNATNYSVRNTSGSGGQAGWFTFDGTSAATPQIAAMVALANQVRLNAGQGLIGNTLNQRLYALGGRGPDAYFHEVGAPGWDPVTGWGSPRAHSLIPALADQQFRLINQNITYKASFTKPIAMRQPGTLWMLSFNGTGRIQGFQTLHGQFNPSVGWDLPGVERPTLNISLTEQLYRTGDTFWGYGTAEIVYVLEDDEDDDDDNGNGDNGNGNGEDPVQTITLLPIKIVGTIDANGRVSGEFFSIGANDQRTNATWNTSAVHGTFKS